MKRKAFRIATYLALAVCLWTIYLNVLSDDATVRARAEKTARAAAGCGEKCKITGIHGSRGMIDLDVTYDIDAFGQMLVTCRRAYVIAGDYACTASKP